VNGAGTLAAEARHGSRAAGADAGMGAARPRAAGKFLQVGAEKLLVKGATYGTFRLAADGSELLDPEVVESDFAAMAAAGLNSVRLYTPPPRWLLDAALRHGLRVMVGLPWEQHVDFLAERSRRDDIERRVREGVRACAGHPAVLCFSIGNEIPAPIVRWLGPRRVERFLHRLYRAAKAEDPEALVTYVNYPSTEYLRLPFLDLVSFNVYLETQERLDAYLARLHNLADQRPLLMAEVGLDSRGHGEERQGHVLEWQVRTTFAAGCAGLFVFAWTDEWHRGGEEIHDWDFGLTTRGRTAKPALEAVVAAFADAPFPGALRTPRISVVCCSHNGARTIRETMEALRRVEYPDFEVIVVDDGSTDDVGSIVTAYDVRYIRTENRGLSSARNTGLGAAGGEIVAFLDDDAYPDPHWLRFLAAMFERTTFAGIGGPNLPIASDGLVADCVAHSPGGPVHVLLDDREAAHIPGCNMAFRRGALEAIGGFDPAFRTAGDDVDVCWRIQERGWKLGFHPAATVWHHRRRSVRGYLKQQHGYGAAEAMLERKWPEKYNAAGHVPWGGHIYASYLTGLLSGRERRIYHGVWGSAPFQSAYRQPQSGWRATLMMPEWYLVVAALSALCALGLLWRPVLLALPLLLAAVAGPLLLAVAGTWSLTFPSAPRPGRALLARRALTALLHLLQPLARLHGRLGEGLTPWRRVGAPTRAVLPLSGRVTLWMERWEAPETRLAALQAALRQQRAVTIAGGEFDRWDLEVRGGVMGATRVLVALEEHGSGRQLLRVALRPRCTRAAVLPAVLLAAAAALTGAMPGARVAGAILLAGALAVAARAAYECALSKGALLEALEWVGTAWRALDGEGSA
jgi:GT2 family glycosyltransferase